MHYTSASAARINLNLFVGYHELDRLNELKEFERSSKMQAYNGTNIIKINNNVYNKVMDYGHNYIFYKIKEDDEQINIMYQYYRNKDLGNDYIAPPELGHQKCVIKLVDEQFEHLLLPTVVFENEKSKTDRRTRIHLIHGQLAPYCISFGWFGGSNTRSVKVSTDDDKRELWEARATLYNVRKHRNKYLILYLDESTVSYLNFIQHFTQQQQQQPPTSTPPPPLTSSPPSTHHLLQMAILIIISLCFVFTVYFFY